MDWGKLIDDAKGQNAHGIEVRRGKKYTTVAVRVEIMRRVAGGFGVATEIVHYGTNKGDPVVVKATISDEAGRILATGHAEEIRGQGQVNSTSALENAETSAIGRALAALGVSGGEFASANEMEGVERKSDAITSNAIATAVANIQAQPSLDTLGQWWALFQKAQPDVARTPAVIAAKDQRKGELAMKETNQGAG